MAAISNPGTAGGSGWWINLGGLKILILKGCASNNSSWRTIDWTAVGFTEAPSVVATNTSQGTSPSSAGGWIELTSLSSPAGGVPQTNGCSILTRTGTGSNSNSTINLVVIGK